MQLCSSPPVIVSITTQPEYTGECPLASLWGIKAENVGQLHFLDFFVHIIIKREMVKWCPLFYCKTPCQLFYKKNALVAESPLKKCRTCRTWKYVRDILIDSSSTLLYFMLYITLFITVYNDFFLHETWNQITFSFPLGNGTSNYYCR